MPGFGYGNFGYALFGQFNWSLRVLFESSPEIYRTADLEQGNLFRRYAEAQGVSFDNLRLKIASFADLRNPRAVRTRYDEVWTLRLGAMEPIRGPVEQGGVIASVSGIGVFTALRAHFTSADIGKELTISGSSIATNNMSVVVTNFVSPTELLTNPPLSPDVGPFRWELRALETSLERKVLVKVLAGNVEHITPGWILTDGYTDFTVLKRQQFKSATEERKLLTLRGGADGSMLSGYRFTSPTLALTSSDVGRKLTIAGSLYPQVNEGKFEIVDVLSATECALDSVDIVYEPTGTLVWALLRDPEITLRGTAVLRGIVEQQGEDGVISTATNFVAVSGKFSSGDVGKLLTIHQPGNADNGTYQVAAVVSSTEITLVATLTTAVTSGVHWELRPPTRVGDETQVEVRAPNLLQYLAVDFGIELDNREEEEWQRRWVESVSRWIGLKGHEDSYRYLAELTGFTADVSGLYRVSQEIYLAAVAAGARTFDVGEAEAGRFGFDGSLTLVAGFVRFSSPTAAFENWDVGRVIIVEGTDSGTNDGLRTVASVISSTVVEFRSSDGMTGSADANNGTITWRIARLYADQPPTLPVHDEIEGDRMTYLKTAAVFTVDKFCWEQSPSPWSTLLGAGDGLIVVTSVNPLGASAFPVSYTVEGRGDFDVAVGLGEGKWKLTDGSSVEHFLETVPTLHRTQLGSDGALTHSPPTILRRFTSASAVFTAADVGRVLLIENALVPANNKIFLIEAILTAQSVRLSASQVVVTDGSSAIRWQLFDPDATGVDGSLTAPRRFTSPGAAFTAADVGKRLFVGESGSGNNRMFVVDAFVDANNLDLEAIGVPVVPDANNGSLVWALCSFEFQVVATTPPTLGAATLEYICPEQLSCDYCKSNKVLVEATTPYLLEKGFERLQARLDQCTPRHVERVENFGLDMTAALMLTASVDAP